MSPSPPDVSLLTPSRTRKILDELGHSPRKALGQNFLIDGNIVEKSLELGGIKKGDRVVEIGPGLGTLSRGLLSRGAFVHGVELDPALAGWLERSLGKHPDFNLKIGDACEFPLAGLDPTPGDAFKIIANLPYAISSTWMEDVLAHPVLPERMVILVQRETADRMTAVPGTKAMSAIAIFLQGAFERRPGHPVPASCFFPAPKVDSTLFHLVRRPEPFRFPAPARERIRRIFTQRRKQLGALARKFLEPAEAKAWLDGLPAHGAAPHDRPESLPFSAWRELARVLSERG